MQKFPRVLVVSHTVFSANGNMGRTMADFLSAVPSDNLSQLYFHSEVPTLKICQRYFRVTDRNVLKSVFTRKAGFRVFNEMQIETTRTSSRTDKGIIAKIYQYSRRRTPLIYFARDLMWKLGVWKSKELDQWITDFNPEVIFFAAGDYVFPYRIVEYISTHYQIPVVMWCCDDHYLNRKENGSLLYRYNKNHLIKWARKIGEMSSGLIAISDKMQEDYSVLFQKDVDVLRISAKENQNKIDCFERKGIIYAGNLGVDRLSVLLEVGAELKKSSIEGYNCLDVYSSERDPERLSFLKEENGIRFHGAVPQGELASVLAQAKYLLHIESFDGEAQLRTRYSLSTKIGESLQSHAVILAYGPQNISSMDYLKKNGAAAMVEKITDLNSVIEHYNENEADYQAVIERAVDLARRCHNKELNDQKILNILTRKKQEK